MTAIISIQVTLRKGFREHIVRRTKRLFAIWQAVVELLFNPLNFFPPPHSQHYIPFYKAG